MGLLFQLLSEIIVGKRSHTKKLFMTQKEEKEIIRVCGPNYKEIDIPAYIRRRDEEKARALSLQEDAWWEEEAEKEWRERQHI